MAFPSLSGAPLGLSLLTLVGQLACAPAPRAAEAPAVVAAAAVAPAPSRLLPLFGPAAGPTIFAAAGALRLGMPVAEAQKAAPDLFGPAPAHPAGLPDVGLSGEADAYGRLAALVIELPRAGALADVMGLWGEPVKGYDPAARSALYWWFDPASRLRARLEDGARPEAARLVLERYFPVAALIGSGGHRFGFEKESLLGMSGARVATVFRDELLPEPGGAAPADPCDAQILVLPPVEYDGTPTRVRLQCGPHGVSLYELLLRYEAHADLRDEILAILRHKYGSSVAARDLVGRPVLDFRGVGVRVRYRDDPVVHEVVVSLTRASKAPHDARRGDP
jgi:hypothetical protein